MIDWNAPRYLDLPDLRMAIFEAGSPKAGQPSVVLCHGWPELGYSWRHIVPPLVQAGFHVIVPDQRGYGATGNALSDKGDEASAPLYDMEHLCGDMANLLDALNVEQAVFVGHDWGGLMTWQLPFHHPSRVAGLIGVNTPLIPRGTQDPITTFRDILGDDFYIVVFQDYGRAEAVLEGDVGAALRFLYRKSDPDAPPFTPKPEHKEMWDKVELINLVQLDESQWGGKLLFEAKDFAYYENAFKRTGFRGGINWYRNLTRNWQKSADFPTTIDVPSLMICAADDRVLPPSMADGMSEYVSDLQTHIISDCGHWTQNEQPEQLASLMAEWLSRRFAT